VWNGIAILSNIQDRIAVRKKALSRCRTYYGTGESQGQKALPESAALFFFEVSLTCAAHGANPVRRDVFEFRAGLDAAVRVAFLGVIDIAAEFADIPIHKSLH
jgi:hypothetical protein